MTSPKNEFGRRHWTPLQRQRLLARFHRSQLTQREFASRHGVGLSTLSKWLRSEGKATLPRVKFQELALPNAAPGWAVEVVSPKGWTVRLQESSAIRTLPRVLRALC